MNIHLSKLIEAECEYLLKSGWILYEVDTYDHHMWIAPENKEYANDRHASPMIVKTHSIAVRRQRQRDGDW